MKLLTSLAGTVAGAITVTIIDRVLRKATGRRKGMNRWVIIGIDLAAGVLSAVVMRCLENRNKAKPVVSPYNPPVESYKPVVDITV